MSEREEQEKRALVKQGEHSLNPEELYRVSARLDELGYAKLSDYFFRKAEKLHVDHAEVEAA